jgi:hypothetical protein
MTRVELDNAAARRLTVVERIAIAVAEEYPDEREAAPSIAEQLIAISETEGIPVEHIAMWIRDRPRHELSAQHWRQWSKRYMVDASTSGVEAGDAETARETCEPRGMPLRKAVVTLSIVPQSGGGANGRG